MAKEADIYPVHPDDKLLSIYVNQLSPWFPFMSLPPETTLTQLSSRRPFLLSVIRMVASVSHLRSMYGQMYTIIEHISDYVLVRSERSLDLLHGILLLLAFYHNHCLVHAQFNNLIQLAISMATDLGLSRFPRLPDRTRLLKEPDVRTNEERRTIISVWYMSSR